ncbi:hypothetical protein AVEN_240313-1 [Araneus ventricosus]|uniref:Uncharacterized protein n=1 Tax=Araneus ventricosus TaxID=182803 RepID=A0A4Y2FGB0_ARAVE|nr:hypothetical protein AVEN_240313-1 [Araneus ventricosus]
MVAVAIETGYRAGNPFRVGRSSFKFVKLAHLAPNRKERTTAAKPKRRTTTTLYPPQTGTKNKIKPRLPSDSIYSKGIFPNITSCYSNRHQPDNLTEFSSWTDSSD